MFFFFGGGYCSNGNETRSDLAKFDSNSHLTLDVFPLIFLSKIHVGRDILWGGKNIFSTIFNNSLNMCFMHTFLMELKYTIYYSSPNSFSYMVSKHFLHAEYEDPCLITR